MRNMTEANLKDAFAGESQAHMKYAIFAEIAEKENLPEVARLFKAISYAELVHAKNHLRELGGIGDTSANLETAFNGENYENTEMYPAFDAVARLQKEKGAIRTIFYAIEAEKIHEAMYTEARESVLAGNDIKSENVYICPVCGHTHIGEAPDKCPVCAEPKASYIKF